MPWDLTRANLYRKIVPDMTQWLPEEECAVWRTAFEAEMVRLDAAVAAAYGWPADLPDEDILARLFALNQERAAAGR